MEINERKSEEKDTSSSPEKSYFSIDEMRAEKGDKKKEGVNDLREGIDDKAGKIESIDDIRRSSENSALRKWEKANPEIAEIARLNTSSEQIKKMEWTQPEKWRTLDETQKRVALDRIGEVLMRSYDHPKPSLFVEENKDKKAIGSYGDGYKSDSSGNLIGADYGIELNREGELKRAHEKIFGKDPKLALGAYAHEFRHSYQYEQASRYEKPQFASLVDNPEKAREWSENIKTYNEAPPKELLDKDPDEYRKRFDKYANQPVEKDANNFADELIKRIYG